MNKVMVLGAGVMALGVAINIAGFGYDVTIWYYKDINNISNKLKGILGYELNRNKISLQQYDQITSNINITNSISKCSESDIIIECIIENLYEKLKLFENINKYITPDTIVCTNTSSFSVNKLAMPFTNKSNFIGVHFFNPVDKIDLIEVVKCVETSEDSLGKMIKFIESIKKDYVIVKDCPGFIVNRLMMSYLNNAANLLNANIATVEEIDKSMRLGANHPLGPFALCDLIGIDIVYNILLTLHHELREDIYKPSPIFENMVKLGMLGKKSGEGFYKYKNSLKSL